MANLPETPDYPAGVYQLETSDPVLGGPGGISNRQAEQLANRTSWLKAKVDAFIDGTVAVLKATKLATARTLSVSGAASGSAPFDGSADANIVLTLADSGAVAGTYPKVTVNAKGIVTGGAALVAADIPTNLALAGAPSAPTPAQFDISQKLATMEALQRALGNYAGQSNYAVNTVLTAAEAGKLVVATSGATITLPLASQVVEGTLITVFASAVSSVVQKQGTDTLNAAGGEAGPFTLQINTLAVFRRLKGGGGWSMDGGDFALKYSSMFGASLAGSGYQKLPSGWILQWGYVTGNGPVITFPIAFPASVYFVGGSCDTTNGATSVRRESNASLTTVQLAAYTTAGVSVLTNIMWIAIGK